MLNNICLNQKSGESRIFFGFGQIWKLLNRRKNTDNSLIHQLFFNFMCQYIAITLITGECTDWE